MFLYCLHGTKLIYELVVSQTEIVKLAQIILVHHTTGILGQKSWLWQLPQIKLGHRF